MVTVKSFIIRLKKNETSLNVHNRTYLKIIYVHRKNVDKKADRAPCQTQQKKHAEKVENPRSHCPGVRPGASRQFVAGGPVRTGTIREGVLVRSYIRHSCGPDPAWGKN